VFEMGIKSPSRAVINELYLSLVLLHADNGLLGTVGSWGDSLSNDNVLAALRAWNEATLKEAKADIEHYEIASRRPPYSEDEGRKTSPGEWRAR
jgi:hypothetical protein